MARDFQGTSEILPPVTVNNEDQEAQYAAKGYAATTDKAAFDKAVTPGATAPQDYVFQEYPKWVLGKLVNSRGEELALTGSQTKPAKGKSSWIANEAREGQVVGPSSGLTSGLI